MEEEIIHMELLYPDEFPIESLEDVPKLWEELEMVEQESPLGAIAVYKTLKD